MSRYNEDLDNLIRVMDITDGELEEIIREADSTLAGQNADGDQKIRALLKKAQALQKLNKHDESREYVDQILKLKPEMPEALVRRGNIYNKKKEYGKAVEDYSRAIELKPDYALAYYNRGTVYGRMGEYGKAVEDLSQAIELKPDDAEAYHNRGNAYYNLGEHGKAVEDYSQAIELKPDDAAAYYNRGIAYGRMGKHGKAVEDYSRAIELQPDDAEAYYNRGTAYGRMGKHGKAVDDLSRAIELKPDYAKAYHNRGIAYGSMGDYGKAVKDYSRAIELQPDYAEAYYNRGNAYNGMGKHGKAVKDYSRAIELKPDYAEAYYNRGTAYGRMGKHGKAVKDYSRAIELKPDDAEAYYNRGTAYDDMGEYGKAVKDYSRAIELKPDDAEAYYNRGTAYGRMGKHGKAVDDLSRAIGLKPDDAAAYYNRSLLFCREEKYDKAFQDEIKCFEYIQQSDARDVIAKTQWVVGVIIKNSENLDFIWDYPEEALKKVPHFFPWIIASFIKEGFIGKKYKKLVNAVFRLWKGCYDADSDEDGRPVILYQYTTMPALRAMFENRCLRLSPVSYLNDPNEGTTFFTCLKESANTKELKAYLEKIQEKETGNRDIIFIRSFTGNEDKLVMWDSSYADNGRGVSVGVPAPLVDKGRGTPEPISLMINAGTAKPDDEEEAGQPIPLELLGLFKIRYNRDSVGEIAGCLEEFKRADFKDETLVELLARLFVPVAALIKGEEYRHENEYRLVCITSWKEAAFRKYIKQTEEDGVYIETEAILFQEPDEEDDGPEEEYVEVYMGPKVDKITWLKWRDRFRYKYAAVKNVQQSKIEWR